MGESGRFFLLVAPVTGVFFMAGKTGRVMLSQGFGRSLLIRRSMAPAAILLAMAIYAFQTEHMDVLSVMKCDDRTILHAGLVYFLVGFSDLWMT
jgi:hypothetical protein